jgi:hypothetical protein
MLRITVELIPFGVESKAKKIGELVIANAGSHQFEYGNFNYEGYIQKDAWSGDPAMYCKIEGYDQSQSVWELIKQMITNARVEQPVPSEDPKSLAQRLKQKLGI